MKEMGRLQFSDPFRTASSTTGGCSRWNILMCLIYIYILLSTTVSQVFYHTVLMVEGMSVVVNVMLYLIDVPHLFDCTAHLNDLSPVNLWDKPVKTIRELSIQDQGNLD